MTPGQRHMALCATTGCVIHREYHSERRAGHVHHIAPGSAKRSDFVVACLCEECHTLGGVHGDGVKAFLRMYKLESEYQLLGLQNKYLAIDAAISGVSRSQKILMA
ncbi:MAG: hypothetical protein H6937_07085 [Burkholderiales bacterium]|nr:hypothetical protein [Burkholderiales bacterium]